MTIKSLGYLGVASGRAGEWDRFATRLLGMQRVDDAAGVQAYRMDDHAQRLIIEPSAREGLAYIGWEVESPADLEALSKRLIDGGHAVHVGAPSLARSRRVAELVWFNDPEGNRMEVFHGAERAHEPFAPGRPLSGFVTGTMGMGHAVLTMGNPAATMPFYRDMLGFALSDFGRTPYELYFFHINGRHHSFALVGTGQSGFHHFMIEMKSLDDVGQAYDLAQLEPDCVSFTLGRHSNDYMTSFYMKSPSGFLIEYGWGGRVIDPETWVPHETFDGPSYWGHERLQMAEAQRLHLREMRLDAARRGLRAP